MKKFIWSDNHFGHINICGPTISKWPIGYRNFESLQDMEDLMVNNANLVAGPDDEIIFGGDVIMGFQPEIHLPRIKERFKCKNWILIWGNHDIKLRKREDMKSLFSAHYHIYNTYVDKTLAVICHYPIASWEDCGNGSVHFYGHTHGNYLNHGRSMDVGVDCHNFQLLDIEWCVQECLKKDIVKVDHH